MSDRMSTTLMNTLDSMAEDAGDIILHDVYNVPAESIVELRCKNKGDMVIRGILVDALSFSLESKWDKTAIGSIANSMVLKPVESVIQDLGGVSINQPVLNRRSWGGTSPLEFPSVKMRFQAQTDSYNEVYIPVVKMACLLQPRVLFSAMPELEGILSLFSIPGPSPFGGLPDELNPWKKSEDAKGDIVSLSIGKLVRLNRGYLTKLNVVFSKTLTDQGFPESADVSFSFSAMDTPFYKPPTPEQSVELQGETVGLAVNNVLYDSSLSTTIDVIDVLRKVADGVVVTSEAVKNSTKKILGQVGDSLGGR